MRPVCQDRFVFPRSSCRSLHPRPSISSFRFLGACFTLFPSPPSHHHNSNPTSFAPSLTIIFPPTLSFPSPPVSRPSSDSDSPYSVHPASANSIGDRRPPRTLRPTARNASCDSAWPRNDIRRPIPGPPGPQEFVAGGFRRASWNECVTAGTFGSWTMPGSRWPGIRGSFRLLCVTRQKPHLKP